MSDTVYAVELEVTRRVTFNVTNPEGLHDAVYTAETKLIDGDMPDDEDIPSMEVKRIRVGEREVEFSARYDWYAPKVNGLAPRRTTVRVDGNQVADLVDFKAVCMRADLALADAEDPKHVPVWETARCHPGHPAVQVCQVDGDLWPCDQATE